MKLLRFVWNQLKLVQKNERPMVCIFASNCRLCGYSMDEEFSMSGAWFWSRFHFTLYVGNYTNKSFKRKDKTYPWRFLNPERASVLDIDVDVCSSKRDEVIQAIKDKYGEDRVSKVLTINREKSKSAIQTAARGLGINDDVAIFLSSLIISDRGQLRTLKQMYYGDKDFAPDTEFKNEMDKYPELWEVAQK